MSANNVRKGKGFSWTLEESTGFGTREVTGFTVDNLDTKQIGDVGSSYEKAFVLIRTALESRESYCMDNEEERLQICQDIADSLRSNGIFVDPVRYGR